MDLLFCDLVIRLFSQLQSNLSTFLDLDRLKAFIWTQLCNWSGWKHSKCF